MISIDDPYMPGLVDLDSVALHRIAGSDEVSLMRLRYRPGKRAILHIETNEGEGAVWFFRGDKAKRLARRHKATARYDARSEALFEPFPNDHRMPQIRAFLKDYFEIAPSLIGARPVGTPKILRYRPGLSCTFRCEHAGGGAVYVKLINDDSPVRLIEMNRQMVARLANGPVSVAPIIGAAPDYSAIAYRAATGRPLDGILAILPDPEIIPQAIDALHHFCALPLAPERYQTADLLMERGADSVALTSVTVPEATHAVTRVLARLEDRIPQLALRPIHGDMKLEHIFMDGEHTTLIDTECVSLGPPDYDLAQLYGRLWHAEIEGKLARGIAEQAAREVKRSAGPAFGWCLDIVALRLTKFYAQCPAPDAGKNIAAILERLS